jgi:outer membrane protein OmpA-like peptidoglycan-associated protein
VAIPGGRKLQAVKTDANGNYAVAELPQGRRVEIKYWREGYQEKPTLHYVTLVEGANRDDAKMAPEDAALAQYQEYGEKLFHAESTASIDEDTRVMFAHLPEEKLAALTEGYASVAAAGGDKVARQQAATALRLHFESASLYRSLHRLEERTNALAAQLAEIAPTRRDERGIVVTVPARFASGQTTLSSDSQAQYRELAAELSRVADYQITIEGHTDAAGPEALNEAIATQRAERVLKYLVHSGIPTDKVKAIGMGETSLPRTQEAARRVDLVIKLTKG